MNLKNMSLGIALNNIEKLSTKRFGISYIRNECQLHHKLHTATYYLNPQLHYNPNFFVDKEVKVNLNACMNMLIPYANFLKSNNKLEDFHLKNRLFSMRPTQTCYETIYFGIYMCTLIHITFKLNIIFC